MAIERKIEKLEDGSYFATTVRASISSYDDAVGWSHLHIDMNPNTLYDYIHEGIERMSGQKGSNENVALAKLMKVAIRGLLLAYGNKLLDALLGKEHPKPGKHDDLLPWYTDIFTKIAISYCMKNELTLIGRGLPTREVPIDIQVATISTRPVSPTQEDITGNTRAS